MLKVNELNVSYGAIHALKGISFDLNEGEIVALIGANGAGKSTTLNTISGIMKPDSGTVIFEEEEISQISPAHIVEKGIVQVPEGRKIFARMSVLENLELGAYTIKDKDVISAHMDEVFNIFPRLEERQRQMGGTLSGGEQQMLAIGRALMANPRLLLLDEPSMGLAPILVEQIFEIIQKINEEGVTILLVEQNAQMALSIADRGYVLETGTVALSGDADDLMENPEVQAAYLGG
ncbi:ABC transporter ATP-binding protein [Chloroflexota bacterium]|nr:ABC transporter ATP-binding protein [Chloroflexota bacterium]